ncbi:MAG: site-specific integrase [Alphaproteobacteria bacterium]|nr:site-specific integrase [Alphaproteobacteria bacterium]
MALRPLRRADHPPGLGHRHERCPRACGVQPGRSGVSDRLFFSGASVGGRQRRITIGSYPDWSVAAARTEAGNLKREVDLGNDPMGERHADRAAPTMRDLWDRYKRDHLPRKAARSQADETMMWEKLVLPILGKHKVTDVTHTDIEALHRDITTQRGTPVRANRVIELVRRAFNLATRWEWVEKNPASGQQRNPEEKRQRYLSPEELSRLSTALEAHHEPISADAIRMLMLTGARKSEVLEATWEMFDLDAGVWTKPSAHTKQRKEHRVPVSANALTLLKRIRETADGPYVFPGKGGDHPLTDVKRSWAAVCKVAGITGARIHDLRHSFASPLASGGVSLPMIGAMLGHTQVQTTQRYAHLYDEPLRAAADHVGKAIDMAGKKSPPEKSGKSV